MLSKNLTDTELMEGMLVDDERAFNFLFQRYWPGVYAVAFRYIKDKEICMEITHDIFINIWNNRHRLNINSFRKYVHTSASYHGIRKKRQLKAFPISYIESYTFAEDEAYAVNHQLITNQGETNLWQHEFELEIEGLLSKLPKRCREIYLLSRKENLTITEISSRLNISKRTVENQLTIALKHLRRFLKNTSAFIAIFF